MKIGICVKCESCRRHKAPRGRSVPPEIYNAYCTWDSCEHYQEEPYPGDFWPGETEADFGYPVSANATKELTAEWMAMHGLE